MRVRLYQRWEEVQELSEHWNAALAASASDTIFSTWEWTQAWWKNYGEGRTLFVLAAWEGSELCGVAPLYVDPHQRWGKLLRCLRLIGDGSNDSDYLDFWSRRGREGETIKAFMEFLLACDDRWDWVELHGPAIDSVCLDGVLKYAREKGWKSSVAEVPCASLALPSEWNDYLRLLQPRFRTKVRSSLSFFEERLKAIPRECQTTEDVDLWLSTLFDLHSRRWQTQGESGVFRSPSKRTFYRDISLAALKQDWLAFSRLDWGDRPLALQYGFRYKRRFYLLQEGYDPAFESVRPGLALRAWLIRHWIESGLEQYDFLAGTAKQKMDWRPQTKTSVCLRLAPSKFGALVAVDGPRWRERMHQILRPLAPRVILDWREKISSGPRVANQCGASLGSLEKPHTGRRLIRQLADRAYPKTPLGAFGRAIATRFELNTTSNGRRALALRRREVPVLQILMFHRVNDDGDRFFPSVSAAAFRRQMEYLARHFPVISLDDFGRGVLRENDHKYYVAITFDDGYRDNYLFAFPILKKLALPATIFLATGFLDSGELPWYDQVCLAFKLTMCPRLSLEGLSQGEFSLEGESNRLHALSLTLAWLRSMGEYARRSTLGELFRSLRVPDTLTMPHSMLKWEEIRQMKKEGMTFGAHTVTHPVLAGLSPARLSEEILGSKRVIENRLQVPVSHFAYPFGRPFDIGQEAKQVVQEAGFKTGVTTIWGFNRPQDDPFNLKRFNPWESELGLFAMELDWFRLAGVRRRPQVLDPHCRNGVAA